MRILSGTILALAAMPSFMCLGGDAKGLDCRWRFHRGDVAGAARFKGVCNGDPTSLEPFAIPSMCAFHGEMTLVVEAGRSPGAVNIKASSASLESAAVVLGVE